MGKTIKIKEVNLKNKKINGSKVLAWCWDDGSRVEIQKGVKGKRRLRYIVHELIHCSFKNASESEVLRAEKIIGDALWAEGYRKVDV